MASNKPEALEFPRDIKTKVRFDQWMVPGKKYKRCMAGTIVRNVTKDQFGSQTENNWSEIPATEVGD